MDVSDPLNPTFAGCFGDDGYVHDAQCTIYTGPDTEHQGKEVSLLHLYYNKLSSRFKSNQSNHAWKV